MKKHKQPETIPSFMVDSFVEEKPKDFVPGTFDADGVQVSSAIGADGLEYPDPVPASPTIPISRQVADHGLRDAVQRIIQDEAIRAALQEGDWETEEEANDFDMDEDPIDPLTPYERVFEPPAAPPPAAQAANTPGASRARGNGTQTAAQASDSEDNDTPADTIPTDQRGSSQSSSRGTGRK